MIFCNKLISYIVISFFFFSTGFAQVREVPASYNFFDSVRSKSGISTKLDLILSKGLTIKEMTVRLQDFINNNSEILLPDREIVVSPEGIYLGDNKTLIFQKNSKLRIQPNSLENYGIINIVNSKNVKIYNAFLIGDRYKHQSKKGEWGMGIRILGGKDVLVDNFYIQDCWGDGLYIGRKDSFIPNNINLLNGVVNNNRRNGISITSVKGLSIDRVTAAYTNGTNPQFGIDIEPNSNLDDIDDINFGKFYSVNNRGGMMISLDKLKGVKKKNISISINSFFDTGSEYGLYLARLSDASLNVTGSLKIGEVKVTNNLQPIIIKTFAPKTFIIRIDQFDIISPKNKNFHNQEVMRVNKDKNNVRIQSK